MNRREFMVAASGVTGGAGVATTVPARRVAAQEDGDSGDGGGDNATDGNGGNETAAGGDGNETAAGDGGGGTVEEVSVIDNEFDPAEITIEPGTTVRWVWEGQNQHNVNPSSQPDDADWEGHQELQSDGEYEHTFEVEGDYDYVCDPHVNLGMEGTVTVSEGGGGGGGGEVDIHDLGVPIQKHFVGVATFLSIFVSLTFTFYLLKYGESSHTSSPGRRD